MPSEYQTVDPPDFSDPNWELHTLKFLYYKDHKIWNQEKKISELTKGMDSVVDFQSSPDWYGTKRFFSFLYPTHNPKKPQGHLGDGWELSIFGTPVLRAWSVHVKESKDAQEHLYFCKDGQWFELSSGENFEILFNREASGYLGNLVIQIYQKNGEDRFLSDKGLIEIANPGPKSKSIVVQHRVPDFESSPDWTRKYEKLLYWDFKSSCATRDPEGVGDYKEKFGVAIGYKNQKVKIDGIDFYILNKGCVSKTWSDGESKFSAVKRDRGWYVLNQDEKLFFVDAKRGHKGICQISILVRKISGKLVFRLPFSK